MWIVALSAATTDERPLEHYLAPQAEVRFAGATTNANRERTEYYDIESTGTRKVLAGPSKARLREIYQQVRGDGGVFLPAEVAKEGFGEWVATRIQSRDGSTATDYILRWSDRWIHLDFRPVFEAAKKALPDGHTVDEASVRVDMEARVYRVNAKPAGDIEVPFAFGEPIFVGEAKFHLGADSPRLWTLRGARYATAIVPHPIRFYQPHPCLRKHERIRQCFGASSEDRKRWMATRSKLREVGQIDGYRVYEIEYDSPVKMRSVVVGRSLDELYEVDSCDGTDPYYTCKPAKIVLAGGTQRLIQTEAADGGMYVTNNQSFLWLGPDGPREVDFAAVIKAAENAAPRTEALWQPATSYGIANLRFSAGTYRKADGPRKVSCCVGTVEVPYTLEDGIARPIAGKAVYRATF